MKLLLTALLPPVHSNERGSTAFVSLPTAARRRLIQYRKSVNCRKVSRGIQSTRRAKTPTTSSPASLHLTKKAIRTGVTRYPSDASQMPAPPSRNGTIPGENGPAIFCCRLANIKVAIAGLPESARPGGQPNPTPTTGCRAAFALLAVVASSDQLQVHAEFTVVEHISEPSHRRGRCWIPSP
jgi:hypothetical protein